MKLLLLAILFLSIILVSSTVVSTYALTSKQVKSKVIDAISKQVEGDWSHIKLVIIRESGQSRVVVYNSTQPTPPPTPPPVPPPVPTPTGNVSKVCIVGDLDGSTVPNMMKDCNYKIGLGDLGYKDTLSYFKGLNFDKCLIGNHEAANEDGSTSLEKETLAYCGDSWYIKTGQATIIFGFNTNGNLDNQLNAAKQVPISGIKTVIVLSHKPCYTSPNSHHPVEVKSFCESLAKAIPAGIKVIYIGAHNHQMASTVDGTKFISGAGGRSHYDCGTSAEWTFCNNKDWGFLELTISNTDGATAAKFIK